MCRIEGDFEDVKGPNWLPTAVQGNEMEGTIRTGKMLQLREEESARNKEFMVLTRSSLSLVVCYRHCLVPLHTRGVVVIIDGASRQARRAGEREALMSKTRQRCVDDSFDTTKDKLFETEIPIGLKGGGLVTMAELKAGKKAKKKKKKEKLNPSSLSFDMEEGEEAVEEEMPAHKKSKLDPAGPSSSEAEQPVAPNTGT